MKKTLITFLMIAVFAVMAQGQVTDRTIFEPAPVVLTSVHEDNVQTVTNAYWTYLERQPDGDGLRFWTQLLDNGKKDQASLNQAFLDSDEYKAMARHTVSCNQDYTKKFDYNTVKVLKAAELISTTGQFAGQDLVGTDFDTFTSFTGNAISVIQPNGCVQKFFFNYTKNGLQESQRFISVLSNSSSITVRFDPTIGLAFSVTINGFRSN